MTTFLKGSLLAFCILLIAFTTQAQVKYGTKAGGNLASVRYIDEDISKARLGIYAGLAFEIPVATQLVLRPEAMYSSKGFGFKASADNMGGSQRLNYIDVPIMAGFYPTKKLCLLAGPEFGYLMKAVTRSQGIKEDNTSFYRRFDVGFDLGAAYNFNKQLSVEGRYNYGFKDLANVVFTDTQGNVTGQGHSGANRVMQLGVIWWLSN